MLTSMVEWVACHAHCRPMVVVEVVVCTQQHILVYLYLQQQELRTPASFKTKHMGHPATARAMTVSTSDRATQVTARTTTEVKIIRQSQERAPATQVCFRSRLLEQCPLVS